MATNEIWCYYGVHFGCLCAARDSSCTRCAERLTNAVNYAPHPAASHIGAGYTERAPGSAPAEQHDERSARPAWRVEDDV